MPTTRRPAATPATKVAGYSRLMEVLPFTNVSGCLAGGIVEESVRPFHLILRCSSPAECLGGFAGWALKPVAIVT